MNQQFGPVLYTISIWAFPAIIAITFHEAAHGFAALQLGDDIALRLGLVTFNPLNNNDLFEIIFIPFLLVFLHSTMLIGYRKLRPRISLPLSRTPLNLVRLV